MFRTSKNRTLFDESRSAWGVISWVMFPQGGASLLVQLGKPPRNQWCSKIEFSSPTCSLRVLIRLTAPSVVRYPNPRSDWQMKRHAYHGRTAYLGQSGGESWTLSRANLLNCIVSNRSPKSPTHAPLAHSLWPPERACSPNHPNKICRLLSKMAPHFWIGFYEW